MRDILCEGMEDVKKEMMMKEGIAAECYWTTLVGIAGPSLLFDTSAGHPVLCEPHNGSVGVPQSC